MVALKNIERIGNRIKCDYLPDGANAGGRIVVDAISGDIVDVVRAQYETSNPMMYIRLAQRRLADLIKAGEPFPDHASIATF